MNIFEEIRVREIDSVALIDNTAGHGRRIKDRFAYAISFCISGQITYHHNGNTYVSAPDSVVFLPKGESYTVTCEKSGVFPIINFECNEDFSADSFFCAKLKNPEYCLLAFEKLRRSFAFPRSGRGVHALSRFYDILSHIVTELSASENTVLYPAVKYIEENFCSPDLDNRRLAQCCHISEAYFRRLFTSAFGVPPHRYISEVRIQRAKELLRSNDMSISEISEACGYASVYHFCRAFKGAVGESPGKFRQNSSSLWF